MRYLFDQYQRYKNAQLYIETLRKKGESLRILEVGANTHKNLNEFLPEDRITYLDIEVPEELLGEPDFIQGDATDMTFEDDSFDVIVALDVLEHIPRERRQNFFCEITRVSSRGFVISAPFHEPEVVATEERINANFKLLYGYDHPWLKEHLENGLPHLAEAQNILENLGVKYAFFFHGDLDLWERMTNIEVAADTNEKLWEVGIMLHEFYNRHLFALDYGTECYRGFIVGGESPKANYLQDIDKWTDYKNKFQTLEKNFWRMYSALGRGNILNDESDGIFQLFYDTGKGMGTEGMQEMVLKSREVSFRKELCAEEDCDIITLRLDPMVHNGVVKIKHLAVYDREGQMIWKGLPKPAHCHNLLYYSEPYYLFLEDPQICLENICQHQVTVEFDYDFWEYPMINDEFWRLFMKGIREESQIQKDIQIEQLHESYAREINVLHQRYQAEIQMIYQSNSWRLTKPYRFLGRGLKRITAFFMPYKVRRGLSILLHEGFSSFFEKLSSYRRKKHAEKEYVRRLLFPSKETLMEQRNCVFDKKICFSIVVPLYNTPEKYLRAMIESCQNQSYGSWELCLADGSDEKHGYVGKVVRGMASRDSRIRYKRLERNGGISENTNEALKMASGEFIALLDHDDLLHPAALYEYMKVICEQGADFIYSDELTFEGRLTRIVTLHFKPDFAIDNLRANNYICHFSAFSKELLQRAGMFRKAFDGSQDHDMILRLTEQAEKIVHVPQMLYFWRSHPASVASDINSKSYAIDAGKKAVLSHLERCGLRAEVESSWAFPTIYRIKYELQSHPKISIIIPNKDHVELLSRCIESIIGKSTYDNYEILVVENNSEDVGTFHYYDSLQAEAKAQILHYPQKGFNYARINNYAVERSSGEYILFLNNDIEIITSGWMEEMLMFAQREDVGAVGAKLYYPDDTIQHAGVVLGMGEDRCAGCVHHRFVRADVGYIGRLCYAQDFSAVTAACLLVSREIFCSVGGFDEKFAVAYNDVDLCMAIRKAGYLNVWTPCAEAYHYESVSRGYDKDSEGRERFQREAAYFKEKWQEELAAGDPFYNRNLTLDLPDFSPRI